MHFQLNYLHYIQLILTQLLCCCSMQYGEVIFNFVNPLHACLHNALLGNSCRTPVLSLFVCFYSVLQCLRYGLKRKHNVCIVAPKNNTKTCFVVLIHCENNFNVFEQQLCNLYTVVACNMVMSCSI